MSYTLIPLHRVMDERFSVYPKERRNDIDRAASRPTAPLEFFVRVSKNTTFSLKTRLFGDRS
jgi:hypothetical protein